MNVNCQQNSKTTSNIEQFVSSIKCKVTLNKVFLREKKKKRKLQNLNSHSENSFDYGVHSIGRKSIEKKVRVAFIQKV
jgi:hypothetical protein